MSILCIGRATPEEREEAVGIAIARALLREGASVTICSRDEGEVADAARRLSVDGSVIGVAADVAVRADVERMFERSEEEHGEPDILVCSHGVFFHAPFPRLSDEQWDRTFDVNVKGCYHAGQIAARKMLAHGRGGRIVLIGSMNSLRADPGSAHYCASKAAVDALVRGMAADLSPHGITVNAIAPGWIRTRMTEANLPQRHDEAGRFILNPVRRVGEPEDVADTVLWLVRPEASFVTAQTISVDGGQAMMGANAF